MNQGSEPAVMSHARRLRLELEEFLDTWRKRNENPYICTLALVQALAPLAFFEDTPHPELPS